ncbi:MAG: hypothetical protein ACUVSX_15250 [Aggregatilineales bacterium]
MPQTGRADEEPQLEWQPVFYNPPQLARISDDQRHVHDQMAEFALRAQAMMADVHEAGEIVEAMQLCERKHGHVAVAEALRYATATARAAVILSGLSIRELALRRGHSGCGLLIGELIENWMERRGHRLAERVFPPSSVAPRPGSPRVEIEDCERGAAVALALERGAAETWPAPDAAPYAAFIAALRQRLGDLAASRVAALAESVEGVNAQARALAFAVRAEAMASESGRFRLPATWIRHTRGLRRVLE